MAKNNKLTKQETDLVILSAAVGVYLNEMLDLPVAEPAVVPARVWGQVSGPQKRNWKWSFHPYFTSKPKNVLKRSFWAQTGRNELMKIRVTDKT